jgi:hypothetical protein
VRLEEGLHLIRIGAAEGSFLLMSMSVAE